MSVCWGRRDRQAPILDWHREAPGQGEPLPNPALSPENSTLGYARVQGVTIRLQTEPTSCRSWLLQSQHRAEGDRLLSLT